MIITNKFNLPPPILEAIRRDPYSKGDAEFSATELIESPRIVALRRKHEHEITRDASDFLWQLMGRGLHTVLEQGGLRAGLGGFTETRLYDTIDGYRISGGMDLWEDGDELIITDWKFSTAKAALLPKLDWEKQLNIYAHLLEHKTGRRVTGLRVVVIIRDWMKEKAEAMDSYPQAPILPVSVRLWSAAERLAFVRQRIALHARVRASEVFDEPIPLCTDEERWKKDPKYAVRKLNGARALSIHDDETGALEKIRGLTSDAGKKNRGVQKYVIDFRPGLPHRCLHYCELAPFCDQFKAEQALNLKAPEDAEGLSDDDQRAGEPTDAPDSPGRGKGRSRPARPEEHPETHPTRLEGGPDPAEGRHQP